jgi:hypothetical protein
VARIYSVLVVFALALLISNIILGYCIGDWNLLVQQRVGMKKETDQLKKTVNIRKYELRAVERSELARLEPADELPVIEEQKQLAARQRAAKDALQEAESRLTQKSQEQMLLGKTFIVVRDLQTIHFLLGVLASLVTVLVNSVSVTYFIGTTRWCREVVEEYGLDASLYERSRALKRLTYPWALGGVFVMLGIICAGAAADPGANGGTSADWVVPHFMAAILGTAAIGWAFWVQVGTVGKNFVVIQEILEQVNAIRAQQNLDVATGQQEVSG